jgi:type VI secretion system Hcp family effector
MPLAASLKLDGVNGTGIQKGRENDITVVGFRHEVKNDIDPRTGVPTKARTHSAVVVQKNLDLATPELHQAHSQNREFANFELRFFHMPRSGGETHYYTIRLAKAKIAAIRLVMPDVALTTHSMVHEYEEVEFYYDSITYETPPPPKEGLEAGTYQPHTSTDSGGALAGKVKFAPNWFQEQAEEAVKKMYEAIKDAAQKKFEEDLKKAKEGK